jgi:peptidyl-tRNA hydrolase, PTH1 family
MPFFQVVLPYRHSLAIRSLNTHVDVIVGLGNPGPRYARTRHNLGFDVIDALASRYHILLCSHEAEAQCGEGRLGSRSILLAKPQTYMNRSGRSVAGLVQRYLRAEDHLIVIHDDLDLALGKIKLKHRGGDAGHRGIRSIIEWLGTGEFTRVRMGIGRPAGGTDIIDYVLAPFTAAEMETYEAMVAEAASRVNALLAGPD